MDTNKHGAPRAMIIIVVIVILILPGGLSEDYFVCFNFEKARLAALAHTFKKEPYGDPSSLLSGDLRCWSPKETCLEFRAFLEQVVWRHGACMLKIC